MSSQGNLAPPNFGFISIVRPRTLRSLTIFYDVWVGNELLFLLLWDSIKIRPIPGHLSSYAYSFDEVFLSFCRTGLIR